MVPETLEGRYPLGWETRHASIGLFGFLNNTNILFFYCLSRLMCCFPPMRGTAPAQAFTL